MKWKEMHQMRCAVCNEPASLWATKEKELKVGCRTCKAAEPLESVIARAQEVPFGNPNEKAKEGKTCRLRKNT
jgi:hypothetical protein